MRRTIMLAILNDMETNPLNTFDFLVSAMTLET